MNTEQENAQALAEFRAGRFGAIPDDPTPTDAATRPRWRTRTHTPGRR
jgi:hypothetical protein